MLDLLDFPGQTCLRPWRPQRCLAVCRAKNEKELEEEEEELGEIVSSSHPRQLLFAILLTSRDIPVSCQLVYEMQEGNG